MTLQRYTLYVNDENIDVGLSTDEGFNILDDSVSDDDFILKTELFMFLKYLHAYIQYAIITNVSIYRF